MSHLVPIGNCVDACKTWNPAASAPERAFRYIDLSSVDREEKRITQAETVLGRAAPSRARQLVKTGDILVSTVRPNLNGIAAVPLELDGATASTGFTVLRAREDRLDRSYLFHWLKHPSFINDMVKKATGASYPAVSDRIVRESLIPLPPLPEQRRIAAILDKADALRAKRREAIAKLDQLLQSVFLDMFGDPVTNRKGWEKQTLHDLVTLDAPLVDPRLPEFQGLPHYGPDRIEKDTGRLLPAQTALEDGLISKKFLCDERHILYSKIRPYLNKVALVERSCLCSADVYPIEPNPAQMTRRFLWHVLRSQDFLKHAESFSNRANIPKINRDQLLQYHCFVPPVELQAHFDRISEVFELEFARLESS